MSAVPEHSGFPFDFGSVRRAWLDCRRGKGNSPARWRFEADLERNLIRLSEALRSRTYQPAPSACFVTNQPKPREIFAAAFRDRVVHHLLVRQLEPFWEKRFIHDSDACRRDKGTLDRQHRLLRRRTLRRFERTLDSARAAMVTPMEDRVVLRYRDRDVERAFDR